MARVTAAAKSRRGAGLARSVSVRTGLLMAIPRLAHGKSKPPRSCAPLLRRGAIHQPDEAVHRTRAKDSLTFRNAILHLTSEWPTTMGGPARAPHGFATWTLHD